MKLIRADQPCQAMKGAGISAPNSKEGIDFCVNSCPYPKNCVFLESEHEGRPTYRRIQRQKLARQMASARFTTSEIATQLNMSIRQIERYLDRRKYGYLDKSSK